MPEVAFDFVFVPDGKTEYQNIHVSLNVKKGIDEDYCYELLIEMETAASEADIEKIIEEIIEKRLANMKMGMDDNCKIKVMCGGQVNREIDYTKSKARPSILKQGTPSSHVVSVKEMALVHNLKNITNSIDLSKKELKYAKINRPALQLTGFFDYFDTMRMQVLGAVEYAYLEKMDEKHRYTAFENLFKHPIPCIVLSRNFAPFPEMLELAKKYDIPVLVSGESTTNFIGEAIRWLKVALAPRITVHGVLVDVYGEGLLITGESGIGKSEMALELIKRGHRLVADDAVEIKRVSAQTLIGSCPENIRYFIEVRGIGIIDASKMFGIQAIKETQNIDLVINLEMWDNKKEYDRVGIDDDYEIILGNKIVCRTIPLRPGRNLAMIGESAAINHKQKKMGYSAAKTLSDRLDAMRNSGG